jgi:regulator of replication initiation timing
MIAMATKQVKRRPSSDRSANLKLLCSALLNERDQLQEENQRLRLENDQLKRSLGAVLCEDIPINKRAMLSAAAKEPPLAQLIAELERDEN